MKNFKVRFLYCLLLLVLIVNVGCSNQKITSQVSNIQENQTEGKKTDKEEIEKKSLTISAAASLKNAMEDIKEAYNMEKPEVELIINFGSSGSLQQQIEQGAPVDVFMSAATKQVNTLKEKELLVNETITNILENKVVLIENINSPLISDFNDLQKDVVKKIALGEPKSVPAGQYAEEVLNYLGISESIKSKVVYAKDVREVLTWVETGNVDAGMVYKTDAKISQKVKIIKEAPTGSHKDIIYPAAVVKASSEIEEAKEFINFLISDTAKPIFEKYGFSVSN